MCALLTLVPAMVAIVVGSAGQLIGASTQSPSDTITISAGRLIDGRGKLLRNVTVVIHHGRIARVESSGAVRAPTFSFPGGTVLPGLIDVHVHPTSYEREQRLRAVGDGDPLPLA